MYKIIHPSFQDKLNNLERFVLNFEDKGSYFINGTRNKIKLFDMDGIIINVKSFKKPHFINKIVYKYFRKSKARRSYEYATTLLEKGIGTPQPIAFFEKFNLIGLQESYYASEHLEVDLTFRELVEISDYPDYENILRQFTRFSFDLHEKGIEFKDHSPGNTLIKKKTDNQYQFFLVDLNRMEFHKSMDFDIRMKNMSHLTPVKAMVVVMSNEYAKLCGEKEEFVFNTLWKYTSSFQEQFSRKRLLKKKIKFWIKS